MNKSLLGGVALLAGSIIGGVFLSSNTEAPVYQKRSNDGQAQYFSGAYEYLKSIQKDVRTGDFSPEARIQAIKKLEASGLSKKSLGLNWQDMGPDNVGGRTRAIVVDKDDDNIIYAGAVSGGLWKSTNRGGKWEMVKSFNDNLNISSMVQLPNGHFLIGTGCSFESPGGTGGSGHVGYGLYISKDGLQTFQHAVDQDGNELRPSTRYNQGGYFREVNELAATNLNADEVYIAHSGGIAKYNTITDTLTSINPSGNAGRGQDVDVSADGQVIMAVQNLGATPVPYLSKDGGQTWENLANRNDITPLSAFFGARIEVAVSQDDPNYMYMTFAANSRLAGVYGTEDGGEKWVRLVPGGVAALDYMSSTLSSQGFYNHALGILPGQPGVIIMGGVTLWRGGFDAAMEQIALNFAPKGDPLYVHSDIHEFTFASDGTLYIGCDGGIHRSDDGANTFTMNNKGFNVTQFYDIDYSNDGKVLGGTQDNGTQLIDFKGISPKAATRVTGGDGFDVVISKLNSNLMFTSIYNSSTFRSNDGVSFEEFIEPNMRNLVGPGSGSGFYTTMAIYENHNDQNSQDTVTFTNTTTGTIPAGTEVEVESSVFGKTFKHTLTESLEVGESVKVANPLTSIYAQAFFGEDGVYITREALNFSGVPDWQRVLEVQGVPTEIEFGTDGTMYTVSGSRLYRTVGLTEVWSDEDGDLDEDSVVHESKLINTFTGSVTSVACDPNDANRLVVTVGNYGVSTHVYLCENALADNPTFTSIQNGLPDFPVYAAKIETFDGNRIILGTEVGIFASEDGGQSWSEENGGDMARVPVFELCQQTRFFGNGVNNTGVLYAGTHGRGFMKADNFFNSVAENAGSDSDFEVKAYPNPAVDVLNIEVGIIGKQTVEIFNINGQKINTVEANSANTTTLKVNVSELPAGYYLAKVSTLKGAKTVKFKKQ